MSKPELAAIVRVRIEEGKAGLFYATSPDLRGLLVGKPDIDALFAAIPEAIADLHEAAHGTRPMVIQAARSEDPMVHPWVVIPAANARLSAAAPDLLDSAKAFDACHLVIAEAIRRYDPEDIGLQTRILAALKATREAIQKAETK